MRRRYLGTGISISMAIGNGLVTTTTTTTTTTIMFPNQMPSTRRAILHPPYHHVRFPAPPVVPFGPQLPVPIQYDFFCVPQAIHHVHVTHQTRHGS